MLIKRKIMMRKNKFKSIEKMKDKIRTINNKKMTIKINLITNKSISIIQKTIINNKLTKLINK